MIGAGDVEWLAGQVRRIAQEEIMSRFNRVDGQEKKDGSLISAADLAVQAQLQRVLHEAWPDIAFLGEEMPEEEQRRLLGQAGRLWCLDPLDGTSNFLAGTPFFAVSLALIEEGQPSFGLVYDPVREECFTARRGDGLRINGRPLAVSEDKSCLSDCLAVVDFKRLSAQQAGRLVLQPPYRSQRNFGSVALEWAWLAAGRFHVYLHGGQKAWDYAAGYVLLAESGGFSATLEGESMIVPGLPPRSAVAAREGGVFEEWLGWLRNRSS